VFVGQAAQIRSGTGKAAGVGRVVFVGIAADKDSGMIPVKVRLSNRNGQLRCNVPVRVRFHDLSKVSETK
jgi:hypothetical protein